MRIRRVRPDPGIGQGVERQLGDEIEIMVFAGVDLPWKALFKRTAGIERPELGPHRRIRRAENVLGAYGKRRSGVKGRERGVTADHIAPEGPYVVRLRKAAAHAHYRYWSAFHLR